MTRIIEFFKVHKDGYYGFPRTLFGYGYFPYDKYPNVLSGDIVKGGWTSPSFLFELNQWYKENFDKFNFCLRRILN